VVGFARLSRDWSIFCSSLFEGRANEIGIQRRDAMDMCQWWSASLNTRFFTLEVDRTWVTRIWNL
jgi:hypothetical protein